MRFAYADPPYPGCAHRYPEKTEVDHAELIETLRTYDGWALSTSSVALREVWNLCPEARCAAWVKPFAVYKPNVNPAYTWEPLLFITPVKRPRTEPTVRDHLSCPITLRRGLVGAKPDPFFLWILALLGVGPDDSITDIFPGTGRLKSLLATPRLGLEQTELPLTAPAPTAPYQGTPLTPDTPARPK